MHLVLTGCEYSGTTTMDHAIAQWCEKAFGEERHPGYWGAHDHFKIPHVSHPPDLGEAGARRLLDLPPGAPGSDLTRDGLTDEEQQEFLALSPKLKEMFQRFNIEYHLQPAFYQQSPDHNVVGMPIDEAVYAPLYFGYGGKGQYADREEMARHVEKRMLELAPGTVHILLKCTPEVIRRRMKEDPHKNAVLQDKDVELVLQRFEEEYERSVIKNKFSIDTSTATVKECLAEFVEKIEPLLTAADRRRILVGRARRRGEWL
jgi:hypothetical protein